MLATIILAAALSTPAQAHQSDIAAKIEFIQQKHKQASGSLVQVKAPNDYEIQDLTTYFYQFYLPFNSNDSHVLSQVDRLTGTTVDDMERDLSITYEYDQDGNVTHKERFETKDGKDIRTIYDFDGASITMSEIFEAPTGTQEWTKTLAMTAKYVNGINVESYRALADENGVLQPTAKTEPVLDNDGNVIGCIGYTYKSGKCETVGKYVFEKAENGLPVIIYYGYYDGQFLPETKEISGEIGDTYYFESYVYDKDKQAFVGKTKYQETETDSIFITYEWKWVDDAWQYDIWFEAYFDGDLSPYNYVEHIWNGTKWVIDESYDWTETEYGYTVTMFDLDKDGNVNGYKIVQEWDSIGRLILDAEYFPDNECNWYGDYKIEYEYYKGNLKSVQHEYEWNDGDWISKTLDIWHYDDNDEIIWHEVNAWDGNDWVVAQLFVIDVTGNEKVITDGTSYVNGVIDAGTRTVIIYKNDGSVGTQEEYIYDNVKKEWVLESSMKYDYFGHVGSQFNYTDKERIDSLFISQEECIQVLIYDYVDNEWVLRTQEYELINGKEEPVGTEIWGTANGKWQVIYRQYATDWGDSIQVLTLEYDEEADTLVNRLLAKGYDSADSTVSYMYDWDGEKWVDVQQMFVYYGEGGYEHTIMYAFFGDTKFGIYNGESRVVDDLEYMYAEYEWDGYQWIGSYKQENDYLDGKKIMTANYDWDTLNCCWRGIDKAVKFKIGENETQEKYAWADGKWVGLSKSVKYYHYENAFINNTMVKYAWRNGEWVFDSRNTVISTYLDGKMNVLDRLEVNENSDGTSSAVMYKFAYDGATSVGKLPIQAQGDEIFRLDGVKVPQMEKGINVVGGKKILW